jgi:integrase
MPQKKLKLTALGIPALPPRHRPYPDHLVAGLGLRVGTVRRTWLLRYRSGGRKLSPVLGYHPSMGLGQAREAARKLIERVDSGAPIPTPVPHPRAALTVGTLIDNYEKLRIREGARIKALPDAMASLRRNLKPWLSQPAAQFTKADLRAARDGADRHSGMIAANRFLAYLGPLMKWAAQEDLIPTNFVGDIRRAPESKRTRKLTDSEIVAIWRACDDLGSREAAKNYGRLVRFLLVCAQRRDEAASLRHGDILDGTWRQADNKSSRPHSLKLPPLALALVGQGTAQELVFAGRSGKISGFSKLKEALDEASGISGFVLHDLRRSAASRMQGLGIPNHIIGAVLNHAVPGVAGVYLQDEMETQKADALATWAVALAKIVRPMTLVAS